MFSDESRFTSMIDATEWRRRNERFRDVNGRRRDRYGGGCVRVWGGITVTGRTALQIVSGRLTGLYYRDILAAHVVPFARNQGRRFRFQDNNARAHSVRNVTNYPQAQNITTLPWPALSPDINSIFRQYTGCLIESVTLQIA